MKSINLSEMTNKLANLYLFKGIQPSELADSIFEDSYVGMVSRKNLEKITVILTFKETCDVTKQVYIHDMKYTYDNQSFLLRIEEAVNSKKFKIVWDRVSVIESAISCLKNNLKESNYSNVQIAKILNTLPTNFVTKNSTKLKIAS